MKMMDWGDAEDFISFGEVSAGDAECDADVFLLIAPQNVVGNTIMTNLLEMVWPHWPQLRPNVRAQSDGTLECGVKSLIPPARRRAPFKLRPPLARSLVCQHAAIRCTARVF